MDLKVSSKFNIGDRVYINRADFYGTGAINAIRFVYDGYDLETIYETNNGNFTEDELILAKECKNADIRTIHDIKDGMNFFWLNSRGEINTRTYWADDSISRDLIMNGNAFKSFDEALEALTFRQIHSQLIKEANGYDFDKNNFGYFIAYDSANGSVFVDCVMHRSFPGIVYFDTPQAAKKAIDAVGGETYLIENYFWARW